MKIITVSGDTVKVEDASVGAWALGTVTKPFTNEPLSGSQSRLLAVGCFLGGAIVGGTVGYSIVQKGVKGYQAMVGDKPAAAFASSASDSSMPFDA